MLEERPPPSRGSLLRVCFKSFAEAKRPLLFVSFTAESGSHSCENGLRQRATDVRHFAIKRQNCSPRL